MMNIEAGKVTLATKPSNSKTLKTTNKQGNVVENMPTFIVSAGPTAG